MNTWNYRTWYYHLDPELKMIHVFTNCAALKFPKKYGYEKEFVLRDKSDAIELDRLVSEDSYKVCGPCWAREQQLARQDKRPVRPGFKDKPPDYRPPMPRKSTGRRSPHRATTKD